MRVCPSRPGVSDVLARVAGPLFTLLLCWLVGALAHRMWRWVATPQRVPIPLTPAPRTRRGVAARLLVESFGFRSLLRASKITWFASSAMHYGLLALLLVHLRLLMPVLPPWMVPVLQLSGTAAALTLCGIAVLAVRRWTNERLRYISTPSDHLHLLLLAAIVVSGLLLKRVWPSDLYAVGQFVRGAVTLDWHALPAHAGLWVHLALAAVLIAVFPISKLLHGVGIPFTPTWNSRAR